MRVEKFEKRGMMEIKIGQLWRDCDKRVKRTLEVIGLPNDATALVLCIETGKTTQIQRWRMKPGARGYELIKDVE